MLHLTTDVQCLVHCALCTLAASRTVQRVRVCVLITRVVQFGCFVARNLLAVFF